MCRQRCEISNANGVTPKRPLVGQRNYPDRHRMLGSPGRRFRQHCQADAALHHSADGVKAAEPDTDLQSSPGAGGVMALTTAVDRRPGDGLAERAALQKSMLAYSGKYRVEGDDFITTVDISWNEIWNGTEQRRHYRIEGDRLFIDSAPAPSITNPGKTDFRRLVWEREK
jgi:Lipocalin-like domain